MAENRCGGPRAIKTGRQKYTTLAPVVQLTETGPMQVRRYAVKLAEEAGKGTIRGVLCFEDRADSISVMEVGSCVPLSSRMLLGLTRFVLRELVGE